MRGIVMLLARFALWQCGRQCKRKDRDSRDCMCEPCQWGRGVEHEADAAFGREWRG